MQTLEKTPTESRILFRARDAIISVDRNGLLWVTEFRHPILNRTMEIYSRFGDWDVWTVLIAGLLVFKGKPRRVGVSILKRILPSLAFCFTLKRLAKRSRPSVTVEGFSSLLNDPDPYSFPSSHSATSWAACIGAAKELGGLGWLLTAHAALVSYSRIHVGAHYPLDVLIGTGIGTTVALNI